MRVEDIPENTVILKIKLGHDPDSIDVAVGHNVETDDFNEEGLEFIDALVAGLGLQIEHSMDTIIAMGRMSNMSRDMMEDEEDDIAFEPDQKLLDAIDTKKNGNVVSIKKKVH